MSEEIRLSQVHRQLVVEASPDALVDLRQRLALPNPAARQILQRQPWLKETWDGKIHFLDLQGTDREDLTSATCGIGLYERVKRLAKKYGKVVDEVRNQSGLVLSQNLVGAVLSGDQIAASEALVRCATGCIQLDVSSGKSYIGLNLMASALRQHPDWKFVFLVPKKALLYQMFEDAQKVLPGYEIGILGDGHRQLKSITIATVATAVAGSSIKDNKMIADWMEGIDGILVDEAHHSPAATWKAIYHQSRAKILWGVSAKFGFGAKKRDLERSLEACFGAPRYIGAASDFRVPVKIKVYHFEDWKHGKVSPGLPSKLVDGLPVYYLLKGKGWLPGCYHGPDENGNAPDICRDAKNKVDKSRYGIYGSDGKGGETQVVPDDIIYHTSHDLGIMEFRERDDWAVRIACKAAEQKQIFLITTNRSRHTKKLERACLKAGLRTARLDGSTPTSEFARIIEAWRKKEIDGVVAQQGVVSEGLSIPSLHHLIKLDGQDGEMVLHQQRGRPARVEPGKHCGYLHLPYDYQHPTLLRKSNSSIRYFASLKMDIAHLRYRAYQEFVEAVS